MKLFRLLGTFFLALGIFGTARLDCLAVQFDYGPVETLPDEADASDYIALGTESESYVVQPGDTLWGISRRFWGTGTKYQRILQENQDVIADAHLLMPGDVLTLSESLYIPKDRYDRGGLRSGGGFHIASPDMVQHSYFLGIDMDVDDVFPDDISVYSLPVTNTMGENALTATKEDWEAFRAEVIRCSGDCDGRVSNLQFEKYTVVDGCDLCGYSFDFDKGGAIEEYVVFYRFGQRNMVEVIGKRERKKGAEQDTQLIDVTRYIAASFEDFGGRVGMGYTKMTDNVGAYDWNYPELHNPFSSAMKNYVVSVPRPDKNYPGDHEIAWKEPLLEQALRNALIELWQLTDAEKEAFEERPVMASDLAVITDIDCILYEPGSRRASNDPEADGGPVLYVDFNGHTEKIYPGTDNSFSYEDFGNFAEAETFSISARGLADYSFISNMTHLKFLSLTAIDTVEDIGFLAALTEVRTLQLIGVYSYAKGAPAGFLEITDLSVLENCKELRYLYLRTPLVTDFSFLKECPEICTLDLSGEYSGKISVIPDMELLTNARFLDFYGENYRFEP